MFQLITSSEGNMRSQLPSSCTGPGRPFVTALPPRRAGVVAITRVMILAAVVLVIILLQGNRVMMATSLHPSDVLSM